MFDDLSQAPQVFWVSFFLLLAGWAGFTSFTGVSFAPQRAMDDPQNMPFQGPKFFDIENYDYNQIQKFRTSLGVLGAVIMAAVGVFIRVTGVLSAYPEMESFSYNPVMYVGFFFIILHYQQAREKFHSGMQLCNKNGLLFCAASQFILFSYMWTWIKKVQQLDDVMEDWKGKVVVVSLEVVIAMNVLVDALRLIYFIFISEEAYFTPNVKKMTAAKAK